MSSRSPRSRSWSAALLAASVAIAFADASIVVLALPSIYGEFDVSIVGVSWVITIYAVTVAVVAGTVRLLTADRYGPWTTAAAVPRLMAGIGIGLFTVSSLACGLSSSLGALVTGRVGQGAGAGLLLIGALPILESVLPAGKGHRVWATAAVGGLAVGPALGGLLTEAFEWQAIFLAQAPLAALGMAAVVVARPAPEQAVTIDLDDPASALAPAPLAPPVPDGSAAPTVPGVSAVPLRVPTAPGVSTVPVATVAEVPAVGARRDALLADLTAVFVSAAMVGALFLAVLLVIEVWRSSPAEGALVVSTLPAAALLARWFQRRVAAALRLALGIPLVALGLAAVALLPATDPVLLAAALALCGAGLGLALDVLDPVSIQPQLGWLRSTASSVLARHAGLVLGLVVIAPVLSSSLQSGAQDAALAGTATVLDADLDVRAKIDVARNLRDVVEATPRGQMPDLERAVLPQANGEGDGRGDDGGGDGDGDTRTRAIVARDLTGRVENVLTRRFRPSFALGGALAGLALVPATLLIRRQRRGPAPTDAGAGARAGAQVGVGGRTTAAPAAAAATTPVAAAVLGAALVAGVALVAGQLVAGALSYGRYEAANPCTASPETFEGGGFDGIVQRVALGALNGAACELDVSREQLVLSLDQNSSLAVVKFDRATLDRALEAGALRAIDDAQDRGSIPGPLAAVVRQAIRVAPLGWLADQLGLPLADS